MEMLIPFAGFYCSLHEAEIENAHDMLSMDTESDTNDELYNFIQDKCQWREVQLKYAQEYVEQMAEKYKITMAFKAMTSPKEYNFQTDRIFVEIDLDEAVRLYNNADYIDLRKIAKEKFTSRSGFISHYSPFIQDWGDFKNWDHNQFGCVLEAFIANQDSPFDELDLLNDARENGKIEEWILGAMSSEDCSTYNTMRDALNNDEES